jgi:hypothetical protein
MTVNAFGILMDVVMLVLRVIGKEAGVVSLILFFVLLIVAGVAAYFFDRYDTHRLHRFLRREEDDVDGTEEELFERFDGLALNTSEARALFYLDFAVSHHYMHFYDFSYMKYICAHFHEASAIAHCARVVSWLPYYARQLNFMCADAVQRRDLGLEERFCLYQLERIRMLRESSSSSTAAEKLTSLKAYSSETASMMRAFWERSECNVALLNGFARQLAAGDSLWHEAIEDFPNNVQFRDLYIS